MRCRKSSSKRKVYSNAILPQETRKTLNRQLKFTPKTTGKRRTKEPQDQQKERNYKDPSRNNEKAMKETIVKINKTKSWFFEKINKIDKLQPDSSRKKREESNRQNQK